MGVAGKSELAMVACWSGSFCKRASHPLLGTCVAGEERGDSVSPLTCDGVHICLLLYSSHFPGLQSRADCQTQAAVGMLHVLG